MLSGELEISVGSEVVPVVDGTLSVVAKEEVEADIGDTVISVGPSLDVVDRVVTWSN